MRMSGYTLVALGIFASVGGGIGTLAYWWVSSELKDIKKRINVYDKYIADTTTVINQMEVKLAVQQSTLGDIKRDIADMRSDIRNDIAVMQADMKQLLSRKYDK